MGSRFLPWNIFRESFERMIIFLKQDFLEERAIRKILGNLFQIDSLTHEIWGAT